jgi:hypothetical protein
MLTCIPQPIFPDAGKERAEELPTCAQPDDEQASKPFLKMISSGVPVGVGVKVAVGEVVGVDVGVFVAVLVAVCVLVGADDGV